MRGTLLATLGAAALIAAGAALLPAIGQTTEPPRAAAGTLKAPTDFTGIADPRARSVALFEEAGKVLQHPRCVNCHPAGDRPLQTDRGRLHQPLVVRGPDGHGTPGMACATCHGPANFDPARVPGHPKWHLAPLAMAWQGKTLGEICIQIKDRARNGGMDMEALLHHMEADSLVGWGWAPGADRTPAPGTQKEFGLLMRAWAEAGAHCPP